MNIDSHVETKRGAVFAEIKSLSHCKFLYVLNYFWVSFDLGQVFIQNFELQIYLECISSLYSVHFKHSFCLTYISVKGARGLHHNWTQVRDRSEEAEQLNQRSVYLQRHRIDKEKQNLEPWRISINNIILGREL